MCQRLVDRKYEYIHRTWNQEENNEDWKRKKRDYMEEVQTALKKGALLVVLLLYTVCITYYHLILFQKSDNRSMMVQEAEVKHWETIRNRLHD